ncbi:TadE family protein [Anaerobacillus sp. MEB173]|uniref:TadE family protein n=1 Tax=Anaerobacillus sp. MEB173 TaxID=3383345 RepID=UPI003F8FBF3B
MSKINTSESGQSIVEFAFIIPLLILILVGIFEFGLIFHTQLTLNNVSRDAARMESIGKDSDTIYDEFDLTVTFEDANKARGSKVTAYVTESYTITTPFLAQLFSDPIELESTTVMRVE